MGHHAALGGQAVTGAASAGGTSIMSWLFLGLGIVVIGYIVYKVFKR